jgi:multidrug efflux pump subunit AcrA (membrane-fusion protein)
MTSAIPVPIQTLLDLFSTALADVRFGDVDRQTLGLLAADVETAASALSLAQTALDTAREALQEKQDVLLRQAHRALAYARVYAEGDEALAGQLESVGLPRAARRSRSEEAPLVLSSAVPPPSPRPRGRPRKHPIAEPTVDSMSRSAE